VLLFHRDLGGAGNPPLILLHGMLGSSRNWQTAGAELAVRFNVFALDLRNHGRSPHAGSMTYEEMADDVVRWLDTNGIARATIMGHSMGGKVAMVIACRQPGRVEHLNVVDIAPKNYAWPAHRASFAAMNELNLADLHSRAEAELRLEARVSNWSVRKFLTTNLDRTPEGAWFWQINLPVVTASLSELERNPLGAGERFDGPTRFFAGGQSNYIEPGDHVVIRNYFPHAEIVTLAESGHNPHMEARAAFVRAVLEA
jgi:esterase